MTCLFSECLMTSDATPCVLRVASLFESVRRQQEQQQQQQQRRQRGPGPVWSSEGDWPAAAAHREQLEDVAGRQTRSTSWLTSNTTARSVLPPGYDMLEKPSPPIPGELLWYSAPGPALGSCPGTRLCYDVQCLSFELCRRDTTGHVTLY